VSEGQEELRSLGLDPLFPAQTEVAAKLVHLVACKRGCSQPMSFYVNRENPVSTENSTKDETYLRDLRGIATL
jgi:hypothetical protein